MEADEFAQCVVAYGFKFVARSRDQMRLGRQSCIVNAGSFQALDQQNKGLMSVPIEYTIVLGRHKEQLTKIV